MFLGGIKVTTALMLGIAFIFLIAFLVVNRILTCFRLKTHQMEWEEHKAMLKAFAPYITEDELREAYINFIDEIKCYYPRF